jgi:hypothetical protein
MPGHKDPGIFSIGKLASSVELGNCFCEIPMIFCLRDRPEKEVG